MSLRKNKVVVGIDFGTTFSGIAWAKIGDDQPNLIQLWPGSRAPNSEKVPTKILYDGDDPEDFKWGYEIPESAEPYEWFKLALEPINSVQSSAISTRYSNFNAITNNERHTAEQLTTDYLKALKAHLISTLARELGAIEAKEIPLEFIITVPAVWSEITKEKTLVAAEKAGLGDYGPIHMISEPEAAAIYVLQRKELHNLSVGDTFVVCDAGGGTVDLISYTVVKLDPVIEVREAAPGTGALCGSTYVNRRFKEFLQSRLGQEPGWDDEVLRDAMEEFEQNVKRNYSPNAKDERYMVSVAGLGQNTALGINRRAKLLLKSEDVRETLEPVVAEVVKLVLEQINATGKEVKSVLLVGGFGRNHYLQERIRGAVKHDVEVIKPPYAWSAVVQGALMKGLAHYDKQHATVHLSTRAARKHIGTEINREFDSDIHLKSKKYFSAYHGHYRVLCMDWFIKKGDAVKEEAPFIFNYHRLWRVSEGLPDEITNTLQCDRTGRAPVLYLDDKIEELVRLKADISTIPMSSLRKDMGKDGEMYVHLDYSIEVIYLSAATKYAFIYRGRRYGTVTAEYA